MYLNNLIIEIVLYFFIYKVTKRMDIEILHIRFSDSQLYNNTFYAHVASVFFLNKVSTFLYINNNIFIIKSRIKILKTNSQSKVYLNLSE